MSWFLLFSSVIVFLFKVLISRRLKFKLHGWLSSSTILIVSILSRFFLFSFVGSWLLLWFFVSAAGWSFPQCFRLVFSTCKHFLPICFVSLSSSSQICSPHLLWIWVVLVLFISLFYLFLIANLPSFLFRHFWAFIHLFSLLLVFVIRTIFCIFIHILWVFVVGGHLCSNSSFLSLLRNFVLFFWFHPCFNRDCLYFCSWILPFLAVSWNLAP